MHRSTTFAAAALLSACAHLTPATPCEPAVAGFDAVVTPGATVLLGDMHGTEEIPALVGGLACAAARRGPVVVGLELPAHPALDAYLASDGGAEPKAALLASPFWSDAYQDGRRSVAVLALLDSLRALKQRGLPVEVFGFDATPPGEEPTRDELMAKNVLERRSARPGATFLLMMGNLHARKVAGAPWGSPAYRWLATYLGDVTSLNVRSPGGSMWVCRSGNAADCGPALSGARPGATGDWRLSLERSSDGAFDGVFDVPRFTASAPAAFPELQAQLPARLTALANGPEAVMQRAMAAYQRQDFAKCAALVEGLGTQTANTLYTDACCLARAGRKDEAMTKLLAALDAGFDDLAHVQVDEDLVSLHDDPRWPKPPVK